MHLPSIQQLGNRGNPFVLTIQTCSLIYFETMSSHFMRLWFLKCFVVKDDEIIPQISSHIIYFSLLRNHAFIIICQNS
jgi:hypothetical protein